MYTLRAVDSAGDYTAVLTDFSKLQCNIEFSAVGSSSFDYAVAGINVDVLTDQLEMAVFHNSLEVPDTRFVIEGSNGNLVQRDNVIYRSWSGRNLWKLFEESVTYPPSWPTITPLDTVFNNATPGVILRTLIQAAQSRGELSGITRNFTDTLDADNVAWTHSLSTTFEVGTPLLTIISWMVDQGFIEARMVGRELEVYNPGGLGTDRSIGVTPTVFWSSGPVEEVPEATNSRELRTVALVVGDEGTIVEVEDATAIATYGRRVLAIKQGGVKDNGTLTALGQLNLDKVKTPRRERTTKMAIVPNELTPMFDFIPGDWVMSQTQGTPESLRIRQIVIDVPDVQSQATATLRLNDKFEELEVELNRVLTGITGGSQVGGGGGGVPTNQEADTMPPAVPTGLALATITYVQAGITSAMLQGNWNAVTTNQDGSPIADLDGYRFAWKYTNEPSDDAWHVHSNGDSTNINISGLIPGRNVDAKVGALDRNGNFSGWSATDSIALATDSTPPPTPSTPVLQPYLGQIRIYWDGEGSVGESMPSDFLHVEVHISTINDFTPDATTLIGVMTNPGYFIATDLTYGVPHFVKLKSSDRNFNSSTPSAQASATPQPVSGADLADQAVFLNHLAFSDVGNLIEDGSFESQSVRDIRSFGGPWSYVTDEAFAGSYSVKAAGTGVLSASNNLLTTPVPVHPGDDFMASFAVRLDAAAHASMSADTQAAGIQLGVRLDDGSLSYTSIAGPSKQDLVPDAWLDRFAIKFDSASTWRQIEEIYLWQFSNVGAGNTWVDAIEVRQLLGSVHIANLAVNDALVANLSVGKILSGLVTADVIVGGRIATDLIGNRVEMDQTGIKLYQGAVTEVKAEDSFTRVESNGFGTIPVSTPSSQVWALAQWGGATWSGASSQYSCDGDYAHIVADHVDGTDALISSVAAIFPQNGADWQVETDVYIPEIATGADYRVGVFCRREDLSPHESLGVEVVLNTDSTYLVRSIRVNSGGSTSSGSTFDSGVYEPGWYRIKQRATGDTNEGKFWRLGGVEPAWGSQSFSTYGTIGPGKAGVYVRRFLLNTNTDLDVKFDNFFARAYQTASVETVNISVSGTAFFTGHISTGMTGSKRIRIDANSTFNNEAGITFERGTGTDDFQPTLFAHYSSFDGASEGGIHLMSAEATANSSGRARLSLHRGGEWRIGSERGSGANGHIEASQNLHFYGGQTWNSSFTSQQTMFGNRSTFSSAIIGFTVSWGPTMATTPVNWVIYDDANMIRYSRDSRTTTNFHVTCDATDGSHAWDWWAFRS